MITGFACSCSAEKETTANSETASGKTSASSITGAAAEPIVLKLGATKLDGSLQFTGLEWFADQVNEKTDGAVQIQIYPASTLGSQNEMAEGLKMGTIEMGYLTSGVWASYSDDMTFLNSGFFAFEDEHSCIDFYNSDLAQKYYDKFYKENNIYIKGVSLDGAREFWSVNPVESLADLNGIKLRVPDVAIYINVFSALKCNTTPIAWGECYTALQTGVVDAIEIDNGNIYDGSFQEICKNCMVTNHIVSTNNFAIAGYALSQLSADQQDILFTCMEEASDYINSLYYDSTDDFVTKLEAAGVTFYYPTADQLAEIKEIAIPAVKEYLEACHVDSADITSLYSYTSQK